MTFESLPFDTYTTALTTQIAGGNAPDMAWIFETAAYDFVNSGALYPLTDTLKATPGYNLDEVSAGGHRALAKDGMLYAYPFSTSPFAVFVNNDLIKAAGAKTPAELIAAGQWTWDNAIATASGRWRDRQGRPDRARLQLPDLAEPRLGLERLGRIALERRRQDLHNDRKADGRCADLRP